MNTNTALAFSNDDLVQSTISLETLKSLIPRGYATAPTNPKLSEKYVFASTADVVKDMHRLGWEPVDAKQVKARNPIRSFHMIAFQNPEVKITKTLEDGTTVVDCYPRIIMTNSHDGFNTFKFMIGLYRLVSQSNFVICTQSFANLSIRHIHYSFEELRELVKKITATVFDQVQVMNFMENTQLSLIQKRELALFAIRNRQNDPELEVSNDTLDEILEPLHTCDDNDSLWSTFTTIQEHMIKGLFHFEGRNGKIRKARAIRGLWKDMNFNQALFLEATNMIVA